MPAQQLHDKVSYSFGRYTGIQDCNSIGMVDAASRDGLLLETLQPLGRVIALCRAEYFYSDGPFHNQMSSAIDCAETACAYLLIQAVFCIQDRSRQSIGQGGEDPIRSFV